MRVWEAAVQQAAAIPAHNFDEMIDLAVSFYFLPPVNGSRVGVVGGGGGVSVRSADECEEAGLNVIPLPPEIREELKNRGIPIWDWISNPTDSSILGGFGFTGIDMLQIMAGNQNFDLLIANISEGGPYGKDERIVRFREETRGYIKAKKDFSKPLMVIVAEKGTSLSNYNDWRWKELSRIRESLISAGVPFYPNIRRAARAAKKMLDYYQKRS